MDDTNTDTNTDTNDALASLRAGGVAPPSDADADSDEITGTLLVDYRGRTGPDHVLPHEGPCVTIVSGNDPLVLYPGLNLVDAGRWRVYASHPPIKRKLEDGRLVIADAELRAYSSAAKLRDLVNRTQSPDAIDLLLAREKAKPQSAGRDRRRDPRAYELLERKALLAARRGALDLSGIQTQAQQHAAVMRR